MQGSWAGLGRLAQVGGIPWTGMCGCGTGSEATARRAGRFSLVGGRWGLVGVVGVVGVCQGWRTEWWVTVIYGAVRSNVGRELEGGGEARSSSLAGRLLACR